MEHVSDLPAGLSKPAQRALAGRNIQTLEQLAAFTEKEIAGLHGIGPNALVKIREAFAENGLHFAAETTSGSRAGR